MYKLLVVDDESETRKSLCSYFPWDQFGFSVVAQMENGKQALDYILREEVHVILSDIRMPIMSGIDLAKEVFERKLDIKIVFLSGYRDFSYAQKAIIYGVRNYIVKPSNYKDLVEVFTSLKQELDNKPEVPEAESSNSMPDNEANHNDKIIALIKKYVMENYKNASLESTAELVYMSPAYVSHFFKQKTGQNFSDFLLSVKMKKAMELLDDIRYKTYEVSEMLGYSNPKNFARTFRAYFGISPREYKSKSTGENN